MKRKTEKEKEGERKKRRDMKRKTEKEKEGERKKRRDMKRKTEKEKEGERKKKRDMKRKTEKEKEGERKKRRDMKRKTEKEKEGERKKRRDMKRKTEKEKEGERKNILNGYTMLLYIDYNVQNIKQNNYKRIIYNCIYLLHKVCQQFFSLRLPIILEYLKNSSLVLEKQLLLLLKSYAKYEITFHPII